MQLTNTSTGIDTSGAGVITWMLSEKCIEDLGVYPESAERKFGIRSNDGKRVY